MHFSGTLLLNIMDYYVDTSGNQSVNSDSISLNNKCMIKIDPEIGLKPV